MEREEEGRGAFDLPTGEGEGLPGPILKSRNASDTYQKSFLDQRAREKDIWRYEPVATTNTNLVFVIILICFVNFFTLL